MPPRPKPKKMGFANRKERLAQLDERLSGQTQSRSTAQQASEVKIGDGGVVQSKEVPLPPLPQPQDPRQIRAAQSNESKVNRPSEPEPSDPSTLNSHRLDPSAPQSTTQTKKQKGAKVKVADSDAEGGVESGSTAEKASRTTSLLQDFVDILPDVLSRIIEATIRVSKLNEPCTCGNGPRTVTCFDCVGSPLRCESCFIERHVENPLHWAKVWDPESRTYSKRDISTLRVRLEKSDASVPAVALGHGGRACPNRPAQDPGVAMTLVDINGVHETRVILCHCHGHSERERFNQLLGACFFPATILAPRTAFTFRVLKQFHLLHLVSKINNQDFCKGLFRLTDNVFHIATNFKSFQEAFAQAMSIWRLVTATKRLGQAHGIDDILVHRVKGNLIVHCPACPEPHMNMEQGWRETPPHLCHLNQCRTTVDGNHHANHYAKNGDPHSVSLFNGRAYFPQEERYQKFLKSFPSLVHKTTCKYLNVMNKQDRKKFKNMDITGIVNVQCGHVFIKASTDMQLGERFANSDYALHHANIQHRDLDAPEDQRYMTCIDHLCSYDIGCGWGKNRAARFEQMTESKAVVKSMRVLIPLVHVQNHKDNCMYRHACSYVANAGHFHGETCEQYWAESNPLGAQARQMNKGRRTDVIVDHHSLWNHIKTQNLSEDLAEHYIDARALFLQHLDHFGHLCVMNEKECVDAWVCADRNSRKVVRGEVVCVYRHGEQNALSRKKVFANLIKTLESRDSMSDEESDEGSEHGDESESDTDMSACESESSDTDSGTDNTPLRHKRPTSQRKQRHSKPGPEAKESGDESVESIPILFIDEGLEIVAMQCKVQRLVHALATRPDKDTLRKKVDSHRSKLRSRIDHFRRLQKRAYTNPTIGGLTRDKPQGYDTPEHELLYLPSDFSLSDRKKGKLEVMAEYELKLRQGFAYDGIRKLREISKVLSMNQGEKKDARGQKGNTRAQVSVDATLDSLLLAIDEYNTNRASMIKHGLDPLEFPPMRQEDTYRKPTDIKRQVGDSRRVEGALYRSHSVPSPRKRLTAKAQLLGSPPQPPQAKAGKVAKRSATSGDATSNGWIWDPKVLGDKSKEDMKKWSEESNRVQWFRAEAEMMRFREECESTIADFLRCIRYFDKMSNVWEELARRHGDISAHAIYARNSAKMFMRMAREARQRFRESTGMDADSMLTSGELLAVQIQRMRDKEALEFAQKFPGWRTLDVQSTSQWINPRFIHPEDAYKVLVQRITLVLGSVHLTLMAALGILLWSAPKSFGKDELSACAFDIADLAILGAFVPFGRQGLRFFSLVVYSLVLLPGFNLLLPVGVFLSVYCLTNRWWPLPQALPACGAPPAVPVDNAHETQQPHVPSGLSVEIMEMQPLPGDFDSSSTENPQTAENPPTSAESQAPADNPERRTLTPDPLQEGRFYMLRAVFPVGIGLLILLCINIIFIIDIELTLRRNRGYQDRASGDEAEWGFGQILAMVLVFMPLRDLGESIVRRRHELQTKLNESLTKAINTDDLVQISHLVHAGAHIDVAGDNGQTALEIACAHQGQGQLVSRYLF
ncbi:hypothetical protein NMY22_g13219 [Coprinellus aureogranulatus]|nr:hypothetical protein NMY22_g13219 [Coprinellus aureogranulatus]